MELRNLNFIFTYPVFRNNKFIIYTNIPNAIVVNIVKEPVEPEYLYVREEASGRRSALYSFEPLMRLVRV